jgi:hypothetical protein
MPLMMPKIGAMDVARNSNVVIAQALLEIARMSAGAAPLDRQLMLLPLIVCDACDV